MLAVCVQHYKRLPVGQVVAGQTAALALKKIKRAQVGRATHLSRPAFVVSSATHLNVCMLAAWDVAELPFGCEC